MHSDKYRLDDFELYQMARAFRRKMYSVARQLPANEKFSLALQIRRAALSVTNNIAEGHGRWYYVDNARFCRTARGSVEELIDDLNTCLDENHGNVRAIQGLKDEAYQLIERINRYIAYLRRTKQEASGPVRARQPLGTRPPDTRPPDHQTPDTRPPDTRP